MIFEPDTIFPLTEASLIIVKKPPPHISLVVVNVAKDNAANVEIPVEAILP